MHPEVAKAGCGDKNYLFYNHLLLYFRWNPFLEMRTFLMTIRYFDQVTLITMYCLYMYDILHMFVFDCTSAINFYPTLFFAICFSGIS